MKISVIVPVLNEEKIIDQVLGYLQKEIHPCEIIVVDGGSSDATLSIVEKLPHIILINSSKGRAHQMNRGAEKASGEVLLFMHADCQLPRRACQQITSVLEDDDMVGGRFRLHFDADLWAMRFHAFLTRFSFFSFGDQAYFVKKTIFDQMKGYDEQVPFEDIDFYKRLAYYGDRKILKERVCVSARRYLYHGPMKQKWINLFLVILAALGRDVTVWKEKLYRDVR